MSRRGEGAHRALLEVLGRKEMKERAGFSEKPKWERLCWREGGQKLENEEVFENNLDILAMAQRCRSRDGTPPSPLWTPLVVERLFKH